MAPRGQRNDTVLPSLRLESRDTVTGANAWQPLTNVTLGSSPTVIQQLLDGTNRFYRGAWLP
jgi:hypothetical protein